MITEEQRLARQGGLGGSDIAAILGLSPWQTPVGIWLEKKGKETPRGESEAMWWGTNEEDLVRHRFSQLTDKKVMTVNDQTIVDGCLIAHLDGVVEGDGTALLNNDIRAKELFEAKTSGSEWAEADTIEVLPNGYEVLDGGKGIPVYYQTQGYHYMGRVPSSEKIYFAVKMSIPMKGYSRTKFGIYLLNRDDGIIEAQDAFARDWWEKYVVGDKIPDATNEDEAKRLWRFSKPKTSILVSKELVSAWADLREADRRMKEAEAAKDAAATIIKNAMKDNEALVSEDGKTILATWKQSKDKTTSVTDWEKLAKDKGATEDDIKAATTVVVKTGSRTFLPKFGDSVAAFVADYIDKNKDKAVA